MRNLPHILAMAALMACDATERDAPPDSGALQVNLDVSGAALTDVQTPALQVRFLDGEGRSLHEATVAVGTSGLVDLPPGAVNVEASGYWTAGEATDTAAAAAIRCRGAIDGVVVETGAHTSVRLPVRCTREPAS